MDRPKARRCQWIGLCLIAVTWLLAPSKVKAQQPQQREPLALTFVDATPQQSRAIYRKLQTTLQNSKGVAYTPASDFLFEAEKFNVSLDVLSQKETLKKRRQLVRRAMTAQQLESIIVYKRLEDTFHLIVLGPNAERVKHFRTPIRRTELNDRQARAILKRLFKVLLPKVRTYRKQQRQLEQSRRTAVDNSESTSPSESSSGSSQQDSSKGGSSRTPGSLDQGVALSLSPILGYRSLTLSTRGPFQLQHSTPFFGGRGRADAMLVQLGASKRAGLGLSGTFDLTRFQTSFPSESATYPGNYIHGQLNARYLHALGPKVRLYGELGGAFTHLLIASNTVYVGSRYTAGRLGAGTFVRFQGWGRLEVRAALLPILGVNSNDGAFGSGATTFGLDGLARFTLRTWSPLQLSIFYDVSWLPLKHPNPRDLEASASGQDIINVLGLSVGYTI